MAQPSLFSDVCNLCFDSIKVILCWSMIFSIIFCLTDFMFSAYFGLKLSLVYFRGKVLLIDYLILVTDAGLR